MMKRASHRIRASIVEREVVLLVLVLVFWSVSWTMGWLSGAYVDPGEGSSSS